MRKRPGVKAPYPGFVPPALADRIAKPPSGDRWIHEIKFDGYRVQLHIHAERIRVFTRRGHDWTDRFGKIANDAWHLKAGSAIVDGEVVVPSAGGTTDFAVLQKELKRGRSERIVMYAFDLLYLDGNDLRKLPLIERKDALARLIARSEIKLSESFEIDGAVMFKAACGNGLEGVVSKVRDSRYQSGRTSSWVKLTCRQRETLKIVGYAMKENNFDGLYLGRVQGKELLYAGKVDHGFSRDSIDNVRKRLAPLVQKAQAYSRKIKKPKAIWVKPELDAEIEYRAQSAEGKLRHPSFKGLREDL